ncbi:WD40-repeat-containing domain protein [Suillus plorans]|uniref:WD40-repeat-containing domain protein n=1 Tax=Suillus plorans TaxID=116603 RepID=A0A9P7A8P3_9AGAM|nr:WD40-repeat-containing domain protein [Suillus plorans]XP_041151932.1 WD40-repeat-containing domain protein [Suillus plorans]KAG1784435.1 WD40-repeat-containing domain protein [Suillus plorans]KAG1784447.1 WD40-repeat-containing domain protein [Suillus plorans]
MEFANNFTLNRHTKAVNVLAVSKHGSLLLTGGNDGCVVVWSLTSGEMIQEIHSPAAGYISAIIWADIDDRGETMFAFGASNGNIQMYEYDALFEFRSATIGHLGAIESLAWDPNYCRLASAGDGHPQVWNLRPDKTFTPMVSQPEKQVYVACTIHFYDKGASLLVSYLESGDVALGSQMAQKVSSRIGNAALDGNYLLVSNLKDGVDKYAIPNLTHVQSFNHVILRNIPLQISVARQSGLLFVGGDDGFAQIFDYTTGAYRGQLDHGSRGDCITPVVSHEGHSKCLVITGTCLNGHSSMKVWGESDVMPEEHVTSLSSPSPSTAVQLVRFAIICVLVNALMHALQSGAFSTLYVLL